MKLNRTIDFRSRKLVSWGALSLVGLLFAIGCASDDDEGDGGTNSKSGSANGDQSDLGFSEGNSGKGGATSVNVDGDFQGFGGASDDPNTPTRDWLPEEFEDQQSYRAPVATGKYLWSANPLSGRIALIDAKDLTVQVLSAGLAPTFLTSLPVMGDTQGALVINTGSSDVSRFRVTAGKVSQDRIATHVGANRWSVSSSGKWAVAWSGEEEGVQLDPTEGLQEITVLKLDGAQMVATRITVGYRPSDVLVSEDDARLVVVSQEGITQIDLSGTPDSSDWIELGVGDSGRDVSLSEDGNFALVREANALSVQIIDLTDSSSRADLAFNGRVTDADLSASGRAVVVVREKSELSLFDLEEVFQDPTAIDTVKLTGEFFGSVDITESGNTALVYTTAVLSKRVSVVDLNESGDDYLGFRPIKVPSPVLGVNLTPDGDHAVILAGDDLGNRADGFSLISLAQARFPRVVGTAAPVTQMALSNDFGLVTTSDQAGVHEAHLIRFPGLSVETTRLATEPLATGALPDFSTAYVAQRHPEGRVTFFELNPDLARTLTGFELSAEVVDE